MFIMLKIKDKNAIYESFAYCDIYFYLDLLQEGWVHVTSRQPLLKPHYTLPDNNR